MTRYPIQTIEHHTAELARHADEHSRRNAQDVADVGLSQWAGTAMISYHRRAIEALELGNQNGINGPATTVIALTDNGRRVDAVLVDGRWGHQWKLSQTEATKYGRRFLPTGQLTSRKNSRVLKSLGLCERELIRPAVAYLTPHTAGIGCAFWFTLDEVAS
jgi:hypothetical protein